LLMYPTQACNGSSFRFRAYVNIGVFLSAITLILAPIGIVAVTDTRCLLSLFQPIKDVNSEVTYEICSLYDNSASNCVQYDTATVVSTYRMVFEYDGGQCNAAVLATYAPVFLAFVLLAAPISASFDMILAPMLVPYCFARRHQNKYANHIFNLLRLTTWNVPSILAKYYIDDNENFESNIIIRNNQFDISTTEGFEIKNGIFDFDDDISKPREEFEFGEHEGGGVGVGGGEVDNEFGSRVHSFASSFMSVSSISPVERDRIVCEAMEVVQSIDIDYFAQAVMRRAFVQLCATLLVSLTFALAAPIIALACLIASYLQFRHHTFALSQIVDLSDTQIRLQEVTTTTASHASPNDTTIISDASSSPSSTSYIHPSTAPSVKTKTAPNFRHCNVLPNISGVVVFISMYIFWSCAILYYFNEVAAGVTVVLILSIFFLAICLWGVPE
jgi:hypothetical protein